MKTKGQAHWAYITNPDTKWDDDMWCVNLEMSKEEAQKLKDIGIKIKESVGENDEIIRSYKFRRYCVRRDGTGRKNKQPALVDSANQPFAGIVGNGSDVIVLHKPFRYHKGGGGWGTDLKAIQIVNLVPYVAAGEDGPAYSEEDENEAFDVIGPGLTNPKVEGEEDLFVEDATSKEEMPF